MEGRESIKNLEEEVEFSWKSSPSLSMTDSPIITLHGRPLSGSKVKTERVFEIEIENEKEEEEDHEIILKTPIKNQNRDFYNFTNQHQNQKRGNENNQQPNRLSWSTTTAAAASAGMTSSRSSPRVMRTFKSPKSSPKISRLPIRRTFQPKVKALNLPLPDDDELLLLHSSSSITGTKVTPEKLMEELKEEFDAVRRRKQNHSAGKSLQIQMKDVLKNSALTEFDFDEEISLSMPFTNLKLNSPPVSGFTGSNTHTHTHTASHTHINTNTNTHTHTNSNTNLFHSPLSFKDQLNSPELEDMRPIRLSLRNRTSITVEAPDLPVEDPLEIARQTIQNTKFNGGYKACKLIFTTERRDTTRPESPEPAFSKKTGLMKHFLTSSSSRSTSTVCDSDSQDGKGNGNFKGKKNDSNLKRLKLKFNRVLKFFDDEVKDSAEDRNGDGDELEVEGEKEEEEEGQEKDHKINFNLKIKPEKSCIKKETGKGKEKEKNKRDELKLNENENENFNLEQRIVVEVKKIIYERECGGAADADDDGDVFLVNEEKEKRRRPTNSTNSMRRSPLTGAKRTKKENIS